MSDVLQEGIAAARAGNRAEARTLLMRVVEADERNEQAWLWLAGVVDDPEDMRTCLHNVLELNPNHEQARQGLAWIDTKYGPAPTPQAAPPIEPAAPAPAAPAAQAYDPLASPAGRVYTGPTTRLVAETASAETPPMAPQVAPAIAEPIVSGPPENPCPYCGTPTTLAQKNCTQCRQSLMMRGPTPDKRSLPLTILGILWIVYGAFALLGGILGTIGLLVLTQASRAPQPRGASAASGFSPILVIPVALGLLIGLFIIRLGRGLLRRERWTYYVVIGLSALSLLGALCNIAQLGGMLALLGNGRAGALPPGSARNLPAVVAVASATIFVVIGLQALYLLLVGLSYRDFFGPQVRFQPEVETADDVTHYNNGIAYKNRSMWYMAVQEWFAASRKKPHDKVYLQALGLAYAQIKKLYPSSPTYLQDVASFLATKRADLYALAPELEQIKLLG